MKKRVMMVGSAEQSAGGVASVIRLMKEMPFWEERQCYWLGTQIQANKKTKTLFALSAYLKAFFIIWKYDIIHFHTVPNISMKIQLPVFLLAKLWRKKIVLHLHVGNQLTMKDIIKFRLAHWCMNKADRIILIANTFANFMEEYWYDVKTPKTVIYNACEKVESKPYEKNNKNILFAGRFTENKAADILIKAFAIIHNKYPDWRLQILAKGPEEEKCRKMIYKLGLKDKVELPGFVFGDTKANYFRNAGIFCLCSYYEGFPIVILEAWAYGIPVITTPVGALPEVIEEGKNGYIFKFGDYNDLAEKLDFLIRNEELRLKMSSYGKDFVNDNFSIEKINSQIDILYNNLFN